ncbi:hypothetical protein [uncultured Streptomyces sp.]|uniref:hypothetical protein n=1 Tax=uncultured Streptomyces sp. TaxID=174707 RepID=UPI002623E7C0|nr:hypothetical protein [uncultured Streptomyces sp.]
MSKSPLVPAQAVATPAVPSELRPFLLTARQGEAARELLSFAAALPLEDADARLLAMVLAIRAARSGVGNLSGSDLRSLRLGDPERAVAGVVTLGWNPQGDVLTSDPSVPIKFMVQELSPDQDPQLPFGKVMRSRVSGWSTRTLAAKPLRKASPEARLAALYLAAHHTPDELCPVPSDLPAECREALPELLTRGFLAELESGQYLLAPAVRHLAGVLPGDRRLLLGGVDENEGRSESAWAFDEDAWVAWKDQVSPALRRHVAAVEECPLCHLATTRVAEAFTRRKKVSPVKEKTRRAYEAWKEANPDCGPQAAEFSAAFRVEHGHGPSLSQFCEGMQWKFRRPLRLLVVSRLVADGWLANTDPVPWTLRPGPTSGIAVPPAGTRSAAGAKSA